MTPSDNVNADAQTAQVDVLIVAHNAGDLLLPAVRSAAEQAGAEQVWVIDAESTDGSVNALRSADIGVQLLAVPNHGFSASNNRGMEATDGPFVLLLNPDAVLTPGALGALMETARAHPSAGIIGAAIYNPDGSAQANSFGRFPTLMQFLVLRVQRLSQRLAGNTRHSPTIPPSTRSVDWVTGAAMLVRREAIDESGAMDEGFFLYYEDIEWCHRMRDNGWEVLLEPASRVTHHLGGAAAPSQRVAQAYRASLDHYCDLYNLWGLKAFVRLSAALRRTGGGA